MNRRTGGVWDGKRQVDKKGTMVKMFNLRDLEDTHYGIFHLI